MLDKNIRPASCTCPIANGSDDLKVNTIWCTALENNTSFESCGLYGPNDGWLNIIAA
jgi:hypothetical protein